MEKYIGEILRDFPDRRKDGSAKTPAAEVLFEIWKDTPSLSSENAQLFHTYVMKLLYLSKRALPDIGMAIEFMNWW